MYPGIGWFLLKDFESLHRGIIFEVDYLGERELTFTLNFSKGASHVIAQYYQFLRLGKKGYKAIFNECYLNAKYIECALRDWESTKGAKFFRILSSVSSGKPCLPVVAFTTVNEAINTQMDHLAHHLKSRGWIIPVCKLPLPPGSPMVKVARIVIREAHSEMLANLLVWDIHKAIMHIQ